ncbi:MAG: redoxin domain-containing protein [Streptosporangiales bacterium]|nr:redoxin domain-containing protein [Streptosporangiales bacterium]
MARWRLVLVVVAVLAVGAAGATWVRGSTWSGEPGERVARRSSENPVVTGETRFSTGRRPPVPAVTGATLDGGRLSMTDLRGHVVVVNVWGSWCLPCQEEAPDLARVARETRRAGVRFVGIDTRDSLVAAREFDREFGIPYPSLSDPQGKIHLAFEGIVPASAVPSTVVVDRDGRIAARVIGRVTYGQLRGLVDDVVAEHRARPATSEASRPG